jgi:hypothetical protein
LLVEAAFTISRDEPAIRLRERNMPDAILKSKRREQVVEVVRNDRIVEWVHDMGEASAFTARQFQIIGGFTDPWTGRIYSFETVGNLMDIAELMHKRTAAEWDGLSPDEPLVDWEGEYHDEADRRRLAVSKRGVNGPYFSRMR